MQPRHAASWRARRIGTLQDPTKNAAECAAAYDKLRRAELRRNCWRFSTRKAALRPMYANTTYLVGGYGTGANHARDRHAGNDAGPVVQHRHLHAGLDRGRPQRQWNALDFATSRRT